MSNANHKQRVLNGLLGAATKPLGVSEPQARSVLEQLIYAVCREGVSRTQADNAFESLRKTFFDWNEIRVSGTGEVQTALAGLSHAGRRAQRIVSLLREVFETTFSYDLDAIVKRGVKQAEKQLERYEGSNPYIIASTLQVALDAHHIPLDGGMMRALQRMEMLNAETDSATAQASLEHLVPKAKGMLFVEAVSEVVHRFCHERSPQCNSCPMNDVCPTGEKARQRGRPAARNAGKTK